VVSEDRTSYSQTGDYSRGLGNLLTAEIREHRMGDNRHLTPHWPGGRAGENCAE